MRKSKYIQSALGDVFGSVHADLKNEKKVLFSGTPCQIAGLKSFLGKEYANLLSVDLICHGVSSPKVWTNFLQWMEKKNKAQIKAVTFRNKVDFGWKSHVESLHMKSNRNDPIILHSRVFAQLFSKHNILRPCCFQCPYKSILRPGDITIGDYWGIDRAAPDFKNDNKGISIALVNSQKGLDIFHQISEEIHYQPCNIQDSLQPPLIRPYPCPSKREGFWHDFNKKPFETIARKYGYHGLLARIKRKFKKICRQYVTLIYHSFLRTKRGA